MKQFIPRKRTRWLIGGSVVVLLYSFLTDPNGGTLTAAMVGQLATPILAVWFGYIALKALFDYMDGEEFVKQAYHSPIGAGIVFLGRCIVFAALIGLFGNQLVHADPYIPPQAYIHAPALQAEQERLWADHPKEFYSQD
jgi:hypothetical protein